MKRVWVLGALVGAWLAAAPAALAMTTQTATAGNVTATFSFAGKYPNYRSLMLSIAQAGTVLYNQPVTSKYCGPYCAPGDATTTGSSVHAVDLDATGTPNVLLDLYSGGAHCCTIEQLFTFDPTTMTYDVVEHDFGDPGYRLEDLSSNGQLQFVTADDSFAYTFTDFAASGLPLQIVSFSAGKFTVVTGSYPKLIAKDAALWLKAFKSMAKSKYQDSVGVIAAWAADEDELGNSRQVSTYLRQQARLGHLNSALGNVGEPGGTRFIANLNKFLRRHGYLK
jgi:hypothetical protein